MNWADLTRGGKEIFPNELSKRLLELQENVFLLWFQINKPNPSYLQRTTSTTDITAAYFTSILRRPISTVKKTIYKCIPKWSVLSIIFIGENINELLSHKFLLYRPMETLRHMGYTLLPNYTPTEPTDRNAVDSVKDKIHICVQEIFWVTCFNIYFPSVQKRVCEICPSPSRQFPT